MARTKLYFAEQVLLELNSQFQSRDLKIDYREILARMDQMVNEKAKADYFERFKTGVNGTHDEQFLTRLEWLTPTDPSNKMPSYVTLTTNYVSLPDNGGIDEVYFQNDFSTNKKKYFDPVLIRNRKDIAGYRSSMSADMEGRISCYPQGVRIYFDRGDVGTIYGNVGVALVVRDFSTLADSDIYPIPADAENGIITALVEWFRARMAQPQDLIKDAISK